MMEQKTAVGGAASADGDDDGEGMSGVTVASTSRQGLLDSIQRAHASACAAASPRAMEAVRLAIATGQRADVQTAVGATTAPPADGQPVTGERAKVGDEDGGTVM